MGHALMENRNGLIVGAVTTTASGYAERGAALALIEPHAMSPQPVTLGADKGYDSADFVTQLQDKAVTPHVAQNTSSRRSAIDDRITRHPGYAISQRIRKRIEEAFGWAKTVAGLRKMRHRGLLNVDPADRATAEADSKIPPTYMAFLKRDGAAGRRIGVLRHACRPSASDSQVLAPIRPSCRRFGSCWGGDH
jgi:hypothetical protein